MALCFICVSSLLILSSINYISASPSMITHLKDKKIELMGLHWWCSGKESACQCRRHGFDPWSEKIPYAEEQLSLCTTTIKPVLHNPGAATTEPVCHVYWSPGTLEPVSRTREAAAMSSPYFETREQPLLCATREDSCSNEDPHSQKEI